MLTTLLPGLRELRAPLAAGYIWLLAWWLAFEPRLADRAEATDVLSSLYRLDDALSGFGLAAVASFVAYLTGSLSATLFSNGLKGLFRRKVVLADVTSRLDPLSDQGLRALGHLARETRERMESALALSDTRPGELVGELRGYPAAAHPAIAPPRLRGLRARLRRRRGWAAVGGATLGPLTYTPDPDDVTDARLLRAAVDDLPQVMQVRLLGRDPDLFAAVDRRIAEVEFRLAVIPPVLALAAVALTRLSFSYAVLAAALGIVATAGLFWDALNRQREANDTLADALADRRVNAPSLERLETAAASIANRPEVEAMRAAAAEFAKPLEQALEFAREANSDFSRADRAAAAAAEAGVHLPAVGERFTAAVHELAVETHRALSDAIGIWMNALQGGGQDGWADEMRRLVDRAEDERLRFRKAVVAELAGFATPSPGDRSAADERVDAVPASAT